MNEKLALELKKEALDLYKTMHEQAQTIRASNEALADQTAFNRGHRERYRELRAKFKAVQELIAMNEKISA